MGYIETGNYHALTSEFLDGKFWLDVEQSTSVASGASLWGMAKMMPKCSDYTLSQRWLFTLADQKAGHYQISNVWAGTGYRLTAKALDEEVYLEQPTKENATRQLWQVVSLNPGGWELRSVGVPGARLESNQPLTGSKFDGQSAPVLQNTATIPTGQKWRTTQLGHVRQSGYVRVLGSSSMTAWGETGSFAQLDAEVTTKVVFVELGDSAPDPTKASDLIRETDPTALANRQTKIVAAKKTLINESLSTAMFTEISCGKATLTVTYDDAVILGKRDQFVNTDNDWKDLAGYAAQVRKLAGNLTNIDILTICQLDSGVTGGARGMSRPDRTTVMGTPCYADDYRIFVHELLHTWSLPDLYPLEGGHRVGPWDLMADARFATSLLGWHRIRCGWVPQSLSARVVTLNEPWDLEAKPRIVLTPWSFGAGVSTIIFQAGQTEPAVETWCVELGSEVRGSMNSAAGAGVIVYKVTATPASGRRELEIVPSKPISDEDAASKQELFSRAFITAAQPLPAWAPFTLTVGETIGKGIAVTLGPPAA